MLVKGLVSVALCLSLCAAAEARQLPPAMVAQAASPPITAADARATAEEFARLLEAEYLDPDTGRRYAAAVRAASARGDYDEVGTGAALAERLTHDAQAVSPDGHLRISEVGREPGPPMPQMVRQMSGAADAVAPLEPGLGRPIEVARWLAPGVAYIRIAQFDPQPEVLAAFDRFMKEHADASVVIFDVRTSPGGSSIGVNAIFPYLFAEETALMRAATRASVAARRAGGRPPWRRVVSSDPNVLVEEDVVTPHPVTRGLFDARVFVLTSGHTASAAEHFALALKAAGRAQLIGEQTAGAGNFAHAGRPPIGGGRFTTFIPVGRTYEPRRGVGWEGSGVQPDIAVPSDRAVVEALTRSGVAAAEAERIAGELPPLPRLRKPPRQAALGEGSLRSPG